MEALRQYFSQNPPVYGDAESVLDMLFWYYIENNQMDNEKIKTQFAKLRDRLSLPPQEYDEVFYIVSDLCMEHSRMAFGEGIKVGMALLEEISQ